METLSSLTIVQRALFLMELEQFKQVGSEEIANIAAKMVELRFEAGEPIERDGEPIDKMYIIIEGEVAHYREGVLIRRATRGMPFGLFGLLGIADPDPERLVAVAGTHVVALSREDFFEAVADYPQFAAGFIRGLARTIQSYAKRIESLEKQLASVERGAAGRRGELP